LRKERKEKKSVEYALRSITMVKAISFVFFFPALSMEVFYFGSDPCVITVLPPIYQSSERSWNFCCFTPIFNLVNRILLSCFFFYLFLFIRALVKKNVRFLRVTYSHFICSMHINTHNKTTYFFLSDA
jgi:hypothetical protein